MAHSQQALLVLNPAGSKRLIARAVVALPEVQRARQTGRIIVGNGTTNAYVAEELLGAAVPKWRYAAGVIAGGRLDLTEPATRLRPVALVHGERSTAEWVSVLQEFEPGDVFIKGANAVDPKGRAGVLLASPVGGTVGAFFGIISARGAHLIVAVGLEKLVPDVIEAARHCPGTSAGSVGMAVLTNGRVVTEVEALGVLLGVRAWHVSSGGVAGSEGSVTLAVEGEAAAVAQAVALADRLAQEPAVVRE